MTAPRRRALADPAANAAASVRSACHALEHLEQSMLSAGFREGASAYSRMAEVVLAQRMLLADADQELRPRYEQLGEVARRLFGLLHPYDTVMRQLAVLAPADSEENRVRVVAELERRGRRGASVSQLVRACSLPAADIGTALSRLEASGVVRVRNPDGPSPAYVLVEQPVPQRPISRRKVRTAASTATARTSAGRTSKER
ncbi:MAG TPA: hypothetical protein VHI11_08995 [Jiangellaceae bacterium]|nr:hypothetical protein [Jiangellaceae bacterium]